MTKRGRRVPLVLLVAVVVAGGMPLRARAALVADDFHTGKGGRHNKNYVSTNSPQFNRGIQHITNTTVGGNIITQAAFCKKKLRHCRISQRAKVFGG
jgi:hypothetical protein